MQPSLGSGVEGVEAIRELSSVIQGALEREGRVYAEVKALQKGFKADLNSIVFDNNSASVEDGRAKLMRSRESLEELKIACDLVVELKTYLEKQCVLAEKNVEDIALRVGFSSLPDDILADILVLATRPKHFRPPEYGDIDVEAEMEALKEACSFSHVCRRFRVLILHNPHLWNIISEHMVDISKLEARTERSKETLVDVVLRSYGLRQVGNDAFSKFFELSLLSSRRWRSFTLGKFSYHFQDHFRPTRDNWPKIRENMKTIGRLTGGLTFPCLERLLIWSDCVPSPGRWNTDFHPYWRWSMPQLVDLRISGCIPPSAGVSFVGSLRSLMIRLDGKDLEDFEMIRLALFLSSCKVLERIEMFFLNWLRVPPCPDHAIPSVQDVFLYLGCCKPAASTSICQSIHFPNATKAYLNLSSDKEFDGSDEEFELTEKREDLLQEFFLKHPLIKTFHLDYGSPDQGFIPITPPFYLLISLENLILTFASWLELKFWKDLPDSSKRLLPRLRTLELHAAHMHYVWDWFNPKVVEFFSQLEEQGNLDAFELFSIYTGASFHASTVLEGPLSELLSEEKVFVDFGYPRRERYY
ncbi:hypothetical protein SCHPADRAFT_889501 [Schizopora paradoxa]|uniref:Uncharacterized protein n=1 Tax=Schizopora paradoxa TaxID=27342 RepID=A0A0H2RRA1_9AGAM|nr:hypothetical protein SCHPADRAFT_889501 [Schizopora paradoxa]